MTYKIVVVGGGTAGIIAATYVKKYWKSEVDVTLIYDHSKPGIGVGESLTPVIYEYLDMVGVTREELIKNINATVKLGLKFKNWKNDGKYYYHNFSQYPDSRYNLVAAYDIAHNQYDLDTSYSAVYMENCLVPANPNANQALHIDAVLFSRYIENKFKDELTIVDAVVDQVVKDKENIHHLVLNNGQQVTANFYIDASGFQKALMKHMDTDWIDKSDWMPINRCIPNPVQYEFKKQPPYTTSEASQDGWILQVPLSNRWGAGYLYSSEFTSDDEAFTKFSDWSKKTYNKDLSNTSRVLSFTSGYWKEQWVGNCIAVGLASGFSEPLEATNIHHTIEQVRQFVHLNSLDHCEFDRINYNKIMEEFYENVYLYLRYCYTTNRTDSKFWQYMTSNTPDIVSQLDKKSKTDFLTFYDSLGLIFTFANFTRVAVGLNKVDPEKIRKILDQRGLLNQAKQESFKIKQLRLQDLQQAIDHRLLIDTILNS